MIKPLTRDILLTLIIKALLLFVLWSVCFKNTEKPQKNMESWLLGPTALGTMQQNKQL